MHPTPDRGLSASGFSSPSTPFTGHLGSSVRSPVSVPAGWSPPPPDLPPPFTRSATLPESGASPTQFGPNSAAMSPVFRRSAPSASTPPARMATPMTSPTPPPHHAAPLLRRHGALDDAGFAAVQTWPTATVRPTLPVSPAVHAQPPEASAKRLPDEFDRASCSVLEVDNGMGGRVLVRQGERKDFKVKLDPDGYFYWYSNGVKERTRPHPATNFVCCVRAPSSRQITWMCYSTASGRPHEHRSAHGPSMSGDQVTFQSCLPTSVNCMTTPLLQVDPVDERLQRNPFSAYRIRALVAPQRALETLEPYGRLRLDIIQGTNLLACDAWGTSDPYVEVYVNGELRTRCPHKGYTLNPVWNFRTQVEIWSPNSIVQVRVMDYDRMTEHDLMGFVEFVVADLEPGVEKLGVFELRHPEKLVGTAKVRLREHMDMRDEDATSDMEDEAQGSGSKATNSQLLRAMTMPSVAGAGALGQGGNDASSPSRSNGPRVSWAAKIGRSLKPSCFRAQTTDCVEKSADPPKPSKTRNAGELTLRMCFEAPEKLDDEWFAFCFPRPQILPDAVVQEVVDLQQLWEDVYDIKYVLWDKFLQRFIQLFVYIVSWRCKPLSGSMLLWWWISCFYPLVCAPAVPLWVALFIHLVRQSDWRTEMFAHESSAPLNKDGFKLVASFGSSRRMAKWVERVIVSLGGKVLVQKDLTKFCSFIFRDRAPLISFGTLLEKLKQQPWLTWEKTLSCPRGHPLVYKNCECESEAMWRCDGVKGKCRYTVEDLSSIFMQGRFQCVTCDPVFNLCEDCYYRMRRSAPMWTKAPTAIMPQWLLDYTRNVDEPILLAHEYLYHLRNYILLPLSPSVAQDPSGHDPARLLYLCCVGVSAVLFAFHALALSPFGWLVSYGSLFLWLLLGTVVLLIQSAYLQHAGTYFRASMDYKKYKRRRQVELEQRWKFFRRSQDTSPSTRPA